MTKLMPFVIPVKNIPIVSGLGQKPGDLIYTLALRINEVKVFEVNHDQKWAVEDDIIDPASILEDSYYYVEYGDTYSFLPTTVSSFDLDYVASPSDVVYAFDIVIGRPQYNAANSINPKWNQNTIVEITKRALTGLGVHFNDQSFTEFGKSNTTTGDS